jgi:tRNA (cytidine32/guanosine34-2'-O)-methyltransferase
LFLIHQICKETALTGPNAIIVPFLACGDLNGYDADQSKHVYRNTVLLTISAYELGEEYQFHEVVQSPINPSYQHAVTLKKLNQLPNVKSSETESDLKTSKAEE